MNGGLERICGLSDVLSSYLLGGAKEVAESLMMAGVPTEIKTGYLSNTNAEHCCYAMPFDLLL